MTRAAWTMGLLMGFGPRLARADDSTSTIPSSGQEETESADERGRQLYLAGVTLYEEGQYAEAIVAWEEAYALSERALLFFNIANAHEKMENWRDALFALYRYRPTMAEDERDELEARIAMLEQQLAQSPGQSVGEPVPNKPAATAESDASNAAPLENTSDPDRTPLSAESSSNQTNDFVEDDFSRSTQAGHPPPPFSMFLLGSGVVSLSTGSFFAVRSNKARQSATQLCVQQTVGHLCPGEAASLIQKDRISALVSDGAFLLGAIATTSGVWILLKKERLSLHASLNGLVVTGTIP